MIKRVRANGIPRITVAPPQMDQGARRWLIKYAYKNLWRVAQSHDLDDLVQDGYLMFYIVWNKYPHVRDIPHLMRLFQVTFINHVHDLSKHQSRMANIIDYAVDLHDPASDSADQVHDLGNGYFIPDTAPWYVHAFLRLLCSPEGQRGLRSQYRVRLSGVREETHSRLCRLIGADPESTPILPDALETYFASV